MSDAFAAVIGRAQALTGVALHAYNYPLGRARQYVEEHPIDLAPLPQWAV